MAGCKQGQVEEIKGELWLHDELSADLCAQDSPLQKIGIYRVVSCEKDPKNDLCQNGEKTYDEFISYCAPELKKYFAAHESDVKRWIKLAKKGAKNVYLAEDQRLVSKVCYKK